MVDYGDVVRGKAPMTTTDPTRFGTIPAAAVISACLSAQATVPPRSGVARLFGRSPLSTESRPWYVGAIGELRVADRLARLGPVWTTLHSVPIGERGSDIDHVLVGPAGVFTVNTKFHDDARVWVGGKRILVNGQKTDHLRNSRFEAQRVRKLLTAVLPDQVPVQAVLVFVSTRSITIRERPDDVAVVREAELVRWLNRRRAVLDDDQRGRVASALSRRDTWVAHPEPATEPDLRRFDDLRREVGAAHRARMLWGAGLIAGIVAAMGAFALNALGSLLGM